MSLPVDDILRKLGVERPRRDLAGLGALYRRWCERVPFDNSRKLIHIAKGDPGPLPGDRADEFFAAWLAHGTGGTCWAANGALHALLRGLGFEAQRGIATMLAAPDIPPNHGTVVVDLAEGRFIVDASILHHEPLPLDEESAVIDHFAWGVRTRTDDTGRKRIHWHPFHTPDGMDCRIESIGASEGDFRELHEATRGWSPFNYSLCIRLVQGERLFGFWFGQYGERTAEGEHRFEAVDEVERQRVLWEEVGFSPDHVVAIPGDRPIPPPPGSASAAAQAER